MTIETIKQAQDYLTYVTEERVMRIMDIESLISRHPPGAILAFLDDLYAEMGQALKEALFNDKTSSRINEIVVKMFRVHMAIKTIKTETKEVVTQ